MSEASRNPLDVLAEEFVTRLRRGETPDVDAYAEAHPELADPIRELFPTLMVMEELAPPEDPPPEMPREPLPDALGGYRLRREIGAGGMGIVFEASADDGKRVALKLLHPHLAHRKGFRERFLREAALGRRIDHENVVRVLDTGAEADRAWLVMEYVAGTCLSELAESLGGRVPEALLRHLARQVARGLESVHREGIVHRDIKPSNVMVTDDHRVRIMDFGIARAAEAVDRLSSTGQFVGSVRYAAPEQFRNTEVGPASDLYALGVTLFELATGRHPYPARTPHGLMAAHLHEEAPPARSVDASLSPFLSAVLQRLLAKDPEERIGDARTLNTLLEEGEASAWWAARRRDPSDLGARTVRPATRHDVAFRGRTDARSRLGDAFEAARRGQGRVVFLHGEPGVGKSRLVDAFVDDVLGTSTRVLYGSFPPGGDPSALTEALLAAFGRAGLAPALRRRLADTPEVGAAFADHVMGRPPAANAPALDARSTRSAYARLLEALAAEHPLVWVVDDLHFASAESLLDVQALARATRGSPALLLLTSRAEPPIEVDEQVPLERLARADARAILDDALRTAPWALPLQEGILTAADGNPFFLLEMVREVLREREEGVLAGTATPSSEGLRKLPIPAAVRDLVTVRLRGITEGERILLECAALIGLEFSGELLAQSLDRDLLDVLQGLGRLERRTGLIRSAEDHFRFDHHQVLEVLRDEMAPPLARAYHARIARVLAEEGGDATALALHAFSGGETRLGEGVLIDALEEHRERFENERLVQLADRALAAAPPLDVTLRARVLLRRAHATEVLGLRDEHEHDVEALTEAAEASGHGVVLAQAYHMRGALKARRGRAEEAGLWLERSLALSRTHGDRETEHLTLLMLALRDRSREEIASAVEQASRARSLAHAEGNLLRESQAAFSMASSTFLQGAYAETERHLESCLDLLDTVGPPGWRTRARAYGLQGNARFALGAYDEAVVSYRASLELARRMGDRAIQALNLENLGGTLLALGDLGEALANLHAGLAIAERVVSPAKLVIGRANLGSAYLWAGQLDEADRWLRQAHDEAAGLDFGRMLGYTLHDLALLHEVRGDVGAALEAAEASLGTRRPLGQEGVAASLLLLGTLLMRHDLAGEAEPLLREAVETAAATGERGIRVRAALRLGEEVGVPAGLALFDAADAHLAIGEQEQARSLLERAAGTLPDPDDRERFRASSPAWVHLRTGR